MIDFTTNYPNILANTRLSRLDKITYLALMPSTLRGRGGMNTDAAEVVDVAVVEEDVKDAEESEAEAEDDVTTPIHYLVHMVIGLLFLKLRYMIKVNINYFPNINKLQFKKSKLRLVVSMDTPRLMDMY